MVGNNPYLLLWLEGPLQAWGHDSKFGVRDTLHFPTRSGVLGLLCCARGAGGPELNWLQEMSPMKMIVRSYVRSDHRGKRVLREPALKDFHMVGSGYDNSDPWQSLLIPKTSEGKKAVGGGTKMTYRYYVQDAVFAVVLQVPPAQVEQLSDALKNPTWDIYLGRKNCVPTELIYQGIFDSSDQAIEKADQMADIKDRIVDFDVLEGEHDGDVLTLNDVPIQFGIDKKYRDRRVTIVEC